MLVGFYNFGMEIIGIFLWAYLGTLFFFWGGCVVCAFVYGVGEKVDGVLYGLLYCKQYFCVLK